MFVALPAILVWSIGIPFFALIILIKHRKILESDETRAMYGFLFRGYRKKFFYWEIVIMYRKILMILISVFAIKNGTIV